jgi:pyrimidine operon attenuation protein/uracil phosphoribosyltransferase
MLFILEYSNSNKQNPNQELMTLNLSNFFIFENKTTNYHMSKNIILTNQQIEHTIKRIAYQIYETFVAEEEIVIAGITTNGFVFAEKIAQVLSTISPVKISLCEVHVNKQNPELPITTSLPKESYTNKGLVLVDDVLSSGTTLIYAVRHFLDVPLKKFKTAVLVDRNHKKYPIKADFKGISLSTSLLEHVQVVFEDNDNSYAYLS